MQMSHVPELAPLCSHSTDHVVHNPFRPRRNVLSIWMPSLAWLELDNTANWHQNERAGAHNE